MKKSKLKKAVCIALTSFSFVAAALVVGSVALILTVHSAIVNSVCDTTGWTLKNNEYEVIPDINEESKSISFHVCDKNNTTVFTSKDSWRLWDFKQITLMENNDIISDSGDIGSTTYKYENGKWTKVQP